MPQIIIFIVLVVVFGLLPRLFKYLAEQQTGGEDEERERPPSRPGARPSQGDVDQVEEFLRQMGLRMQTQQRPQRPQPPRPKPQQPQPAQTRQEFVHQAVPQHAAPGLAKPAQAVKASSKRRRPKQGPAPALLQVEEVKTPPLLGIESVGQARRQPSDLMAKPELQSLTPAQKAIVLAEILGTPRATRPYEDFPSRWV